MGSKHFCRFLILCLFTLPLTSCALWPWKEKGVRAPAYFTVGSTEKQLVRSMGPPNRITLKEDAEYWHYGSSWVALAASRVVKYDNRGALKVSTLDENGAPRDADIPDISGPSPQFVQNERQRSAISGPIRPTVRTSIAGAGEPLPQPRTASRPRQLILPSAEDEGPRGQWVD